MRNNKRVSRAAMTALALATSISGSHAAAQEPVQANTAACPESFYQHPVFPGAKLCQSFDNTLPATLVYHADTQQEAAVAFFTEQLGAAEREANVKGRVVLEYQGGDQVIIISQDGDGSQVDVLVKA